MKIASSKEFGAPAAEHARRIDANLGAVRREIKIARGASAGRQCVTALRHEINAEAAYARVEAQWVDAGRAYPSPVLITLRRQLNDLRDVMAARCLLPGRGTGSASREFRRGAAR